MILYYVGECSMKFKLRPGQQLQTTLNSGIPKVTLFSGSLYYILNFI